MAKRITIDPITRIEGHLRIDCKVDNGKIVDAWSSGQMFRGIETILTGRDPREAWIFTQRICGVCTTVHAIVSVRTVENALKLEVPLNARYIRNMITAAHAIHDHIVHFYHLSALDWVDVVSALKADSKATSRLAESLSDWPLNSSKHFKEVKDKIQSLVNSGQLGIFTNGYWGHPAMTLPPEVNLLGVSHYLQALEYQRRSNKIVSILGSKTPHIQNLAVGGVANPINPEDQSTLNMERLYYLKTLIDEIGGFINNAYLVDVCAIGALYKDWLQYGAGIRDYLCVPEIPMDTKGTTFELPGGYIKNGDLDTFKPITNFNDEYFNNGVKEAIKHSWYDGDWDRHPWEEETTPSYTDYNDNEKYSWIKSPTFYGKPAQVGPLANVLCMYAAGHGPTKKYVKLAAAKVSSLAKVNVSIKALHSTPGRHLARAIRCAVIHESLSNQWNALMDNISRGDMETFNPPTFPKGEQRGFGFYEAPRGTLSHWVVIENGKIKHYQVVSPTTWNAGPRNEKNQIGPYEASLIGNPVAVSDKPLEVLRTVHSFDPCLACSVHLMDTKQGGDITIKAL